MFGKSMCKYIVSRQKKYNIAFIEPMYFIDIFFLLSLTRKIIDLQFLKA